MHVAKLNAMVKKKINYMINEDLDVAKDFLEMVEILKEHKVVVNRNLKESRLKHEQAHREQMMAATTPRGDVLVQNQTDIEYGSMNLIDNQISHLLDQGVIDGFQHMFANDLYRLYKEGQLSKA